MKHLRAINRKAHRVEEYVAATYGDVVALQQGPTPPRPHYPMGCALVFSPGWEVDSAGGTAGLCQLVDRHLNDCYINYCRPAQVQDLLNNDPDWTPNCGALATDRPIIDLGVPSIPLNRQ